MTDATDLHTRDTMTPERPARRAPAPPMLVVGIAMKVIAAVLIVLSIADETAAPGVIGALVLVVAIVMLNGCSDRGAQPIVNSGSLY